MLEWLVGIIIGVIATTFGFILFMLWDNYKYKRESKRREETILKVVKDELEDNSLILSYNRRILKGELKVIDKDIGVLTPLDLLPSGFWDLVKINPPQKLTKEDTLISIRTLARFIDRSKHMR